MGTIFWWERPIKKNIADFLLQKNTQFSAKNVVFLIKSKEKWVNSIFTKRALVLRYYLESTKVVANGVHLIAKDPKINLYIKKEFIARLLHYLLFSNFGYNVMQKACYCFFKCRSVSAKCSWDRRRKFTESSGGVHGVLWRLKLPSKYSFLRWKNFFMHSTEILPLSRLPQNTLFWIPPLEKGGVVARL